MRQHLATLIFTGLFSISFGQNTDSTKTKISFEDKIEKCNIAFIRPDNFTETAVIENRDQYYDYAIKHKDLKLEIRYFIRSYDSLTIKLSKGAPQMVWGLFMTTVMNMTRGKRSDFNEFPTEAVKKEFGADWGATTSVKLDCEFGKGYKYATLTTIHKDNVGDIYIFYLYDDIKKIAAKMKDLTNNWFYTMKFKKE
jgi:hypothetical protein